MVTSTIQRSRWVHDKTEVHALAGMVVARHPLSTEAGLDILMKGGNAVDAAIAASLVGSVVQPMANTIGGGGLLLIAHPTRGRKAINYLYEAPKGAHAEMFPLGNGAAPGLFGWTGIKDQLNEIGGLAAGIPGSIAGLYSASKDYGRLPWKSVVEPALSCAANGFGMDWYGALMLSVHADQMKAYPNTAKQYLRDGVYTYRPDVIGQADVHRQPALAETLNRIAKEGPSAFYEGAVADSIARAAQEAGGVLSSEDLAGYAPRTYDPCVLSYRNHTIEHVPYACPTLPLFLNILECFDISSLSSNSAARYHIVAEALKCSWHYRDAFNGDTDLMRGPWGELKDKAFAKAVASSISLKRASAAKPGVDPFDFGAKNAGTTNGAGVPGRHEGTVHISAADSEGCMVALTETVVGNFGCLVTADCGVLLNNGMIAFSPVPGQLNSVAPGKRPSTNMCPVIVSNAQGKPIATLGASGGRKIIPAVGQILNLLLDHDLKMQAAISHPRLDLEGDRVIVDSRVDENIQSQLRDLGHALEVRTEDLSTFEFGNPCGILLEQDGHLTAGVNPFQMTSAAGY